MTSLSLKENMALGVLLVLAACSSAGSNMDPKAPGESPNDATAGRSNGGDGASGVSGSAGMTAMAGRRGAGTGGRTGAGGNTNAGGVGGEEMPVKPADPTSPETGTCWLKEPAFCDGFDKPFPGGRGGDIDDANWAVARINEYNPSQGNFNRWQPTTLEACGTSTPGVLPPGDFKICSGGPSTSSHLNNSFDDYGGFVLQSKRIRRPFDFADRTGVITFDIDGRSQFPTGHGYWFNIFIASEPVPAPYQEGGAIALFAKSGIGIEFQGSLTPCNDDEGKENAVSHVFIEKGYKVVNELSHTDSSGCVKTTRTGMNHFEIHLSQDKLEVFGSDVGQPDSLRKIASFDNLDLDFTRGYVNFAHTHYNSNKENRDCPDPNTNCPILVGYNTYHWDNIGFDGPVLPLPRAYELDDNADMVEPAFGMNVGYWLTDTGMYGARKSFTIEGVDISGAKKAVLVLNASNFDGGTIDYRWNGGTKRSFAHAFPESDDGTRAVLIPLNLADLKAGTNTLEMMSSNGRVVISNGDLEIYQE